MNRPIRPAPPATWAAAALLLAAGGWFAFMAVYQVDDAYIVYRYASNLARGEGFVFNPGDRVEGVTCFLWVAILAPFARAGLPLPIVAPILTALAGLGTLLVLARAARRITGGAAGGPPDLRHLVAPALLALHPSFAYWSVGGLETVPYTLLILLALDDQIREQQDGTGRRSALWIGLAALIRPETPLVAAALGAGRVLDGPGRTARERVRGLWSWAATIAAFLVPFLLFRRVYFGAWLPNTYDAKMGGGLLANLEQGRRYTGAFLSSLGPGFGANTPLTLWIGAGVLIALLSYGLPRPGVRSAAILVLAIGAAISLEGGDWMVLHRFWVPALPAILLLLTAAARSPVAALRRPAARAALALAAALFAAAWATAGLRARNGPNGLAVNAAGYRYAHRQVARFLAERARPDDTVALMDVGIIGYETGLRVIDISGLTDRRIARAPGGFLAKRYPPETILAESPRFIVLVNRFAIDEAIRADPGFARLYRPVFERNHRFNWTPPGSYILQVFERGAPPPPG